MTTVEKIGSSEKSPNTLENKVDEAQKLQRENQALQQRIAALEAQNRASAGATTEGDTDTSGGATEYYSRPGESMRYPVKRDMHGRASYTGDNGGDVRLIGEKGIFKAENEANESADTINYNNDQTSPPDENAPRETSPARQEASDSSRVSVGSGNATLRPNEQTTVKLHADKPTEYEQSGPVTEGIRVKLHDDKPTEFESFGSDEKSDSDPVKTEALTTTDQPPESSVPLNKNDSDSVSSATKGFGTVSGTDKPVDSASAVTGFQAETESPKPGEEIPEASADDVNPNGPPRIRRNKDTEGAEPGEEIRYSMYSKGGSVDTPVRSLDTFEGEEQLRYRKAEELWVKGMESGKYYDQENGKFTPEGEKAVDNLLDMERLSDPDAVLSRPSFGTSLQDAYPQERAHTKRRILEDIQFGREYGELESNPEDVHNGFSMDRTRGDSWYNTPPQIEFDFSRPVLTGDTALTEEEYRNPNKQEGGTKMMVYSKETNALGVPKFGGYVIDPKNPANALLIKDINNQGTNIRGLYKVESNGEVVYVQMVSQSVGRGAGSMYGGLPMTPHKLFGRRKDAPRQTHLGGDKS